jgi:hypothetical protein
MSAYEKGAGNSKKPLFSQPGYLTGLYDSSYNPYALATDVLNHELDHSYTTGTADLAMRPSPHLTGEAGISGYYWGQPTAMRPETFKGLFLTPNQKRWIREQNVDPYALQEIEMNQALVDFNAGRYRLRKDMLENPDNPNYAQLTPEVRKQFTDFPSFIQPGEAGAKQLDELMEFYDKNPQFIPMMGEQARLVGYYKNLKAAIANSEDPIEKAFFQEMLNRMVYNKVFLADNQSGPNMSYTDVQNIRKTAAYDSPDIIFSGRVGSPYYYGNSKLSLPVTVSNKAKPDPINEALTNSALAYNPDMYFLSHTFDDENKPYDSEAALRTKDGKTPHFVSSNAGAATSMLLPMAAGAALGAGIGAKGDKIMTGAAGSALGFGAYLLATALGGLIGQSRRTRTDKEQADYNNSSTLAEWLIPGVAVHNSERNAKKKDQLAKRYLTRPVKLYTYGKAPNIDSPEQLVNMMNSGDPEQEAQAQKFLDLLELAATHTADWRFSQMGSEN